MPERILTPEELLNYVIPPFTQGGGNAALYTYHNCVLAMKMYARQQNNPLADEFLIAELGRKDLGTVLYIASEALKLHEVLLLKKKFKKKDKIT